MTGITDIITAATAALEGLGVLPYVLAGAVIAIVGTFILAAKKSSR